MTAEDEKALPYLVEYPLPFEVSDTHLNRVALAIKGSPIFLNKDTYSSAAIVKEVVIKKDMLLCELSFIDPYLEENIIDFEWVLLNYIEVDPITSLLGPIN